MHRSGLAKVEAAKIDGSWNALDQIESLVVPDDLAAALKANRKAEKKISPHFRAQRGGQSSNGSTMESDRRCAANGSPTLSRRPNSGFARTSLASQPARLATE
jgi:hypothetical protein